MKRTSIAKKVFGKVALTIFIINIFMTISVWQRMDEALTESEVKYMEEVLECVTKDVNQSIYRYTSAVEAFSENHVLVDYLLDVEANFNDPVVENLFDFEGTEEVMKELTTIAEMFKLHTISDIGFGIISIDNFITNIGTMGGTGFSLASRPYFEAATTKSLYISDPYEDFLSKELVISVAQPVYDSTQRVLGIIVVDILISGLVDEVTQVTFGETGKTYIIDRNYSIIMHPSNEYLGTNVMDVNYGGEAFLSQLNNPTGDMFSFDLAGVKKTGGIEKVSDLTGWHIVIAMENSEFKAPIRDVVTTIIVTQVVILLVSTFFCVWGIHTHLAPLKKLEYYVRGIASGDLHTPLDFESNDEIGSLAEELDQCAKSIVATIGHIDETMDAFGRGNFEIQDNFEYIGDFLSIRQSMEHFVDLMADSLSQLKQASEEVGQGAMLMSDRAQELATGSSQQAESVKNMESLIVGIRSTIVETAKNSAHVTEDAQNISNHLVVSKEKTLELADSVKDIRTMSDEVKRIIKAIEEVAFQTNILALNAAVEAARAGEAGRGFAVVADEVRNLSLKTAEAVEETTRIINDIATAIESGSDLAQNNSKEIQQVVADVEAFVTKLSNISLTAQNQANDIGEITKGIGQISAVVSQNSGISQDSAAASEELSSQSALMIDKIKEFHLP